MVVVGEREGVVMFTGIDTAARITAAQAEKIKAQGLSFVGRYLVPESYGKALTAAEADVLRSAGLAILLCWELGAEDMKGGAVKGAEHGARARRIAESMGVPSGTAIYFAADYDVPQKDLPLCEHYLKSAQTALGKYTAGAYGPRRLVEYLHDRRLPYKLWQCVAWSDLFIDADDAIQYAWQGSTDAKAMAAKLGFAVDLDSCLDMRRAGFWMPENVYVGDDETIVEPWYAKDMAWAEANSIMTDGRPEDTVTRAELATVTHRLYNLVMDDKKYSGLLDD